VVNGRLEKTYMGLGRFGGGGGPPNPKFLTLRRRTRTAILELVGMKEIDLTGLALRCHSLAGGSQLGSEFPPSMATLHHSRTPSCINTKLHSGLLTICVAFFPFTSTQQTRAII
jgi:hypothetical protein